MTDDQKKISEMQSLCGRVYCIVSERWKDLTDEEGYGPSSLLRDLKKAMGGDEVRDLIVMNELLSSSLSKQLDINKNLRGTWTQEDEILARDEYIRLLEVDSRQMDLFWEELIEQRELRELREQTLQELTSLSQELGLYATPYDDLVDRSKGKIK